MLTDIDFIVHIVRSGNVAFKVGNLLQDYFLIRHRCLIHIKECDNFLTIYCIVNTLAIFVNSTVIYILTVKHCKIIVHSALVTCLTEGMFDDESLEGEVVWIFPFFSVPIKQIFLFLVEVFTRILCNLAFREVESPDISLFYKQ